MAFLKVKNRAASTLASGVSDSDTEWTVATGEGARFPTAGDFHVTCEDEIVKCTSRTGDVLTVVRAQEGTAAAAHDADKAVQLRITAAIIAELQAHPDLTTGVHGIVTPLFSTASKTYYIDSVSGDDGNGGEADDDAFKTWAKAETMIPITLLHAYTIRIIGDLAEAILLAGRNCNAALIIRGHTTTPADHVVNSITVVRCFGNWRVLYLNSSGLLKVQASLGLDSITGDIQYCEPRNSGAAGVECYGSILAIRDCTFGTDVVLDCIVAANSRVFSRTNTGNGTRYGLNSSYAAVIGKYNTQPTGSTANENTGAGGAIR